MADLVTLAEVKNVLGIASDENAYDAKINQSIANASDAIRTYTDRDFGTAEEVVATTREYTYDGSGYLEVDDFVQMMSVVIDGRTLDPAEYMVGPPGEGVFNWLELPPYRGMSPAMGFTYNLDTLWPKYNQRYTTVQVTARWGWATVPPAVHQAAIWTAVAFMENPRPVIAETIGGVARTYPATSEAIPGRAKDLLDQYVRWSI